MVHLTIQPYIYALQPYRIPNAYSGLREYNLVTFCNYTAAVAQNWQVKPAKNRLSRTSLKD